jgi:hypothetical protein
VPRRSDKARSALLRLVLHPTSSAPALGNEIHGVAG